MSSSTTQNTSQQSANTQELIDIVAPAPPPPTEEDRASVMSMDEQGDSNDSTDISDGDMLEFQDPFARFMVTENGETLVDILKDIRDVLQESLHKMTKVMYAQTKK